MHLFIRSKLLQKCVITSSDKINNLKKSATKISKHNFFLIKNLKMSFGNKDGSDEKFKIFGIQIA